MVFRKVIYILVILVVGMVSFVAGQEVGLANRPRYDFDPSDYHEVGCNDIVRNRDDSLVCEIDLMQEDDNIRIFKEAL